MKKKNNGLYMQLQMQTIHLPVQRDCSNYKSIVLESIEESQLLRWYNNCTQTFE